MAASTDSNFQSQYGLGGNFAPVASYELLRKAVDAAEELGVTYHVGNLLSTDVFYNANPEYNVKWKNMGILGVEMEAAALYMNAAKAGKRALAICTVSDHILRGEALDADARQSTFTDMMKIALNVAVTMDSK
jgi:purine-nucleoside phosphorylase